MTRENDMRPRDERGRLVPVDCPDPNCSGVLVHEIVHWHSGYEQHSWRCNGLTHAADGGPLDACSRFILGPTIRGNAA